jgi:hypothetical protein
MSQPCAIETCKQTSRVLCYCCKKNLCLDHLSNHKTLTDYRSYSLTDQVNILHEQIKELDVIKLNDGRRKLDKWRDDSLKKIYRFYEQKYEELDRYYAQIVRRKQYEIDQLHRKLTDHNKNQNTIHEDNTNELQTIILDTKQRIDKIDEKGIQINSHSLLINNNLIIIGESKTQEFDLTTLSPPYRTLDCSEKLGSALASNGRFLLIDENPILSLFDSDLTIIHQSSWKYGVIYDMCWSSILISFIIITEKNKAFLVNGNNLSINPITQMNNQLWTSCTCSNSLLYLASLSNGVVEFSLLPSICYIKRWNPPMTCKKTESIKDISCNQSTIAIIVSSFSNQIVHLLLRSLTTFNQLFSISLDIRYPLYQLPIRCCPLKNNEWLISDANTSYMFHIDKNGKLKGTLMYDRPPYNAVLFNSNILVIRTEGSINFHQLLY